MLPKDIPVLAVGGVTPDNMAVYAQAGTAGFGIGSSLYKPGADIASIGQKAREFIDAMRAL